MQPLDTTDVLALFTDGGPILVAMAALGIGVFRYWTELRSARKDEQDGRSELRSLNSTSYVYNLVPVEPQTNKGEENKAGPIDTPPKKLPKPQVQPVTFEVLWDLTQGRIDAYHKIATGQSKASFVSSQFSTYVGFALIIFVGYIAARADTTIGAISAGAVGIIGGGLSAYISSTFMRAQGEASSQLREFFLQPVEFARVLAAERLLEGMTDEDKSSTRATMITAILMNTTKVPKTADKAAAKPVKKPTA